MTLLIPLFLFYILPLITTTQFPAPPRLLQSSSPPVLLPQALLQTLITSTTSLISSLYSSFLSTSNLTLTKIQGLSNSTYTLTYFNPSTSLSYFATIQSLPNTSTPSLLDFRQLQYDTISPYNISYPLTSSNQLLKKLYQLSTYDLIQINHTFANSKHSYSLTYRNNIDGGIISAGAEFDIRDNTTKISSFAPDQKYKTPLEFSPLPLNFSYFDANLKETFRFIAGYNGTLGFKYNIGTIVNFIAGAVGDRGREILYYVNLVTEGRSTLETLVSYGIIDQGKKVVYWRVREGEEEENKEYSNINILNAWGDEGFKKVYKNSVEENKSLLFVNQIQGVYNNNSMRTIVFLDTEGKTVIKTF